CTYFDSKEKKAWKNPDFQFLFGNEEVETDKASQGKAVFFDVFPANDDFEIEADIMNPHNTKYYEPSNLNDYPTDTKNPVPIKFLTLKNAKFKITVLLPKESANSKICFGNSVEWKNPKEVLEVLLKEAMKFQGIGAKTNLGYGRLVEDKKAIEVMSEKSKEETIIKNQKEIAKKDGIAPYLIKVNNYGEFKQTVAQYQQDIEIDVNTLLPENDHQPILEELTVLMKSKPPKHRNNYRSEPFKDYVSVIVGIEKVEQWIKTHFPN